MEPSGAVDGGRVGAGVGAALSSLPFVLALLIPLGGIAVAIDPTGWKRFALPAFIFGLVPILDLVLGRQRAAIGVPFDPRRPRDLRFDIWLWAWIPLHVAGLAVAVHGFANVTVDTVDVVGLMLLAASCGLVSGTGINVAHELMHRPTAAERGAAEALMTLALYTHFCVEHVHGHHKRVATPDDPASSRLGESVYAFLPRTIIGGAISAWHLEGQRARRLGLAPLSLRDRRFRHPLLMAAAVTIVAGVAGVIGVVFFVVQAIVAVVLLETINYIEHYALSRRAVGPEGSRVYERTTPWHSWNASERLTNWLLFHLQRHADHHHHASRPFHALRHVDDSPQMPFGYATMLLIAMVPPLWWAVMNPRARQWHARQDGVDAETGADSAVSG